MNYFKKSKRASIVVIYDIESETFLSVFKDCVSFNIPGGKCFENETYEDAAIRELDEETGAKINKKDLKLLLKETCGEYTVATYFTLFYKGKLETDEKHKIGFVPLEYILLNKNKSWLEYHKKIYDIIKNNKY